MAKAAPKPGTVNPLVADLVPAFLARRRDDLAALRAAVSSGELEPARVLGHRLAGSAPGYGFPEMGKLGRDIESAALRRDARALEKAADALEAMLGKHAPARAERPRLRVALLEDDPDQLALERRWLEAAGHICHGFTRSAELLAAIGRESFDVYVLDWMVPDLSGEAVLEWIRQKLPQRVPVMFATARDEEAEIVEILSLGADDYLVKPLRHGEFVARVEALGRRQAAAAGARGEKVGPYAIDTGSRTVKLDGRPVELTPRLYEIARILFEKRETLVSRGYLYEQVWGRALESGTRTVDTHVSRLRRALELDGRHGWRLTSIYQHGYRLEPASA
ncbi:MAG: response regulator [Burkholderiales bacterium]|nr:response regulator [Burkholderiales bacterium]